MPKFLKKKKVGNTGLATGVWFLYVLVRCFSNFFLLRSYYVVIIILIMIIIIIIMVMIMIMMIQGQDPDHDHDDDDHDQDDADYAVCSM